MLSLVLPLYARNTATQNLIREKRQSGHDDAIVVGSVNPSPISSSDAAKPSVGIGGVTPVDGPAPSILGSIDNIFHSVKEYDQYQCLERMLCEYMQTDEETSQAQIEGVFSLFPELTGSNTLLGGIFGTGNSSPAQPSNSLLGGIFGTRNSSPARPPPNRFRPQGPTRFGTRPQRPPFRRPPFRPRPPPNCGIICKRRRKREARQKRQIQYNILKLLKVTGLDSLNAFPYVKAALMGQAHRPDRTRGNNFRRGSNSCSRLYRECPTDPERILDYFNNYNGGIINQVQPQVDNEVTPLVTKIVSEALENSDILGSSSSSSSQSDPTGLGLSGLFDTGDKVLTQSLIQSASGYIGDGLKSLAETITGKSR